MRTMKYMREKYMKKLTVLLFLLFLAQTAHSQQWGLTTNGLYWATGTPNLGVEYSFNKKTSATLTANYNPFTFARNRKLKHWLVQPEFRYWISEAYKGHFLGVHLMGGSFNFSGLPLSDAMRDHRYEGDFAGGGLTYGYQWLISNRLNLGLELGLGYLRLDYNKFFCETCGDRLEHKTKNYFGPTKAAVTLIYLLK